MPNIKPILFNTDMVRALLDNRKTGSRFIEKKENSMRITPLHIAAFAENDFVQGL